jgi:hypothetical protein
VDQVDHHLWLIYLISIVYENSVDQNVTTFKSGFSGVYLMFNADFQVIADSPFSTIWIKNLDQVWIIKICTLAV